MSNSGEILRRDLGNGESEIQPWETQKELLKVYRKGCHLEKILFLGKKRSTLKKGGISGGIVIRGKNEVITIRGKKEAY